MEFLQHIADSFNYWIFIILMMIGLYAMVAKNNLVKKLIGMSIFQTAIILFYVSIGYKENATIPILSHALIHEVHHEEAGHYKEAVQEAHHDEGNAAEAAHAAAEYAAEKAGKYLEHSDHAILDINPDDYVNPLVHVLMLTAIVVGVATLGVGLAITQKLYGEFGTVEESEIIEAIKSEK
ncbi:MAG: NADH-quinone oxidoreductase subunit J [Opitutaceae bacterium]|nr:NADH-quinone oxidoreductase subunit J [Opitutaceae bacterium]|tara:strand:+ start:14951 stop:15490 length:540 start_codon:yes stop_codon:yes gene_type:complete